MRRSIGGESNLQTDLHGIQEVDWNDAGEKILASVTG